MTEPHAIITPLKAIRMLLNGTGVLVRIERWEEIQRHMEQCERRGSAARTGEGE